MATRHESPIAFRGTPPGRPSASGFTLIELLVTVTVLVILLTLAAPSMTRFIATNRIASQTNDFIGALNLARAEAVRRGQSVSLLTTSAAHDFAVSWKVFTDANADGAIPGTVTASDGTVIQEKNAEAGITSIMRVTRSGSTPFTYSDDTSASDADFIVFNARGANDSGATNFYRVCDSGSGSHQARIVQVSPVGRVTLVASDASC